MVPAIGVKPMTYYCKSIALSTELHQHFEFLEDKRIVTPPNYKAVTLSANLPKKISEATSYSHRGKPQLPSALESLTSVFSMGTGVASLPSSLHYCMDTMASAIPQHVVL